MNEQVSLLVYTIVGSPLCVASDDGQKVYDLLSLALTENKKVILSFHNVTVLTSAFLNTAIGQLYGTFTEEKIRSLLDVQDMALNDMDLLKRVVETAKLYFKDPQKFDQTFQDENND